MPPPIGVVSGPLNPHQEFVEGLDGLIRTRRQKLLIGFFTCKYFIQWMVRFPPYRISAAAAISTRSRRARYLALCIASTNRDDWISGYLQLPRL